MIWGRFSIEDDNVDYPCGFDIALCNKWKSPKITFILGDGSASKYSIKTIGDKTGASGATGKSAVKIVRNSGHSKINYFTIEINKQQKGFLYSIYVGQNPEFTTDDLVHQRQLDTFNSDSFHINIKLWKSGTLRLYDFGIREGIFD